jgi:hypothetical protein
VVALDRGVVEAVALRAHRLGDPGGAQALAEDERDVLPEFKESSQRCRFSERIVVLQPGLLDPVVGGGCASVIAEAA